MNVCLFTTMVVVWGARSETMLSSERNCVPTPTTKKFFVLVLVGHRNSVDAV